jgi:hypothetical protein
MFYFSLPALATAFIINSIILFMFNPWLASLYAILFILYILLSALPAKNFPKDFHTIEPSLSLCFLITSVIAQAFTTIAFFSGMLGYSIISVLEWFLMFIISHISLLVSVLHFTVCAQRSSIRESVGLVDNFFAKQKKIWEQELKEIQNANRIIECLDEGGFILHLFDKGFFNLTVLWSCNVMEKIVDATADEIIARNPEKRDLFKTKEGRSQNYPRQLKNLGYEYPSEDKLFDIDTLWNRLRNKIAHHNYKPTFDETYETLKILISFTRKMPKIFKSRLT